MSAAINIDQRDLLEIVDEHPNLYAHLHAAGFDGTLTLTSDKAVTLAYTAGARLEFVHGSRALFDRYVRMTRPF